MEEESMNRREALKTMGLAAIGTGLAMTSLGAAESEFKTGKKLKVMLVNGSPHKEGCTFTALSEIAGALKKKRRRFGNFLDREKIRFRLYRMPRMRGNRTMRHG